MEIGAELSGLQRAAGMLQEVEAFAYPSLLEATRAIGELIVKQLQEATPIGDYSGEPGAQPVPRAPGTAAASWHVAQENQYTTAVFTNCLHAKWLLLPPETEEWLIQPKKGGQRLEFLDAEGAVAMPSEALRHTQQPNAALRAVLDEAGLIAKDQARNLFGPTLQEYVRVK